jgi:Predicted endonuclease involved in recombination (possible Holliday junction resolvase in Mycoplasmas and B. subtilis)
MGLALGDDATGVVSPLAVIPYRGVEAAAQEIARRARTEGAGVVVIGLPTDATGRPTPACRRSHRLAEALGALGLTVAFQAELLTTNEARRRARAAGLDARAPVDHLAAQVILEEFLAGRR